ncbi:hypothetical protein LTSESEN_2343 [Salmonella enterica subsp. enterica serovar Senftenberg str. A4-543]|uniref:Uncharacterized protein n=1 Tax=Salmonella enterica subsp. enterica serovar Senftenberg str. A4-543 TaxID=913082 RepID=G5QZI6_SALSE|nr:hypothetical protein LTSESEN_2343 [Salmonella enterica subsp. enterica serovar Senftenberg str. A4-543]
MHTRFVGLSSCHEVFLVVFFSKCSGCPDTDNLNLTTDFHRAP